MLSDKSGKMLVRKCGAYCCDLGFSILGGSLVLRRHPDLDYLLRAQEDLWEAERQKSLLTTVISPSP